MRVDDPGHGRPLLTYDQGMALSLVARRGLTYREVADRMGRPPSEVLRLLRGALGGLKDHLRSPSGSSAP
ncbi:MAG: sigma-70 family RNA polymerase sigma factor [Acidimicrobiia bacterium]|nr:sigma-70 family RNA polymerase sigma factor [Acidimicrobiia bacterium]